MSATADHAESLAARLGFQSEQVVQEIGYDEDVDQEFRESIQDHISNDLVDEDFDDVADAVLLWFREEDGDLTDTLVDATELVEDGALILLLTPRRAAPATSRPATSARPPRPPAFRRPGASVSARSGPPPSW